MQSDVKKEKKPSKQSGFARWYSFNKQRIPMFLLIVSVLAITATLDFNLRSAGGQQILNFRSHISAIRKTTNNILGFYLFLCNLFVLIQFFLSFSFSQKRSPLLLILMTIITVGQTAILILYVLGFIGESSIRPNYSMEMDTYISIISLAVGTVFMIAATIFAWIYVDWKYVKVED